MAKKKLIPTDGFGSARVLPKIETYKAKPKPYYSKIIDDYLRKRDRFFWLKGTPEERLELEEYWKEKDERTAKLLNKINEKN